MDAPLGSSKDVLVGTPVGTFGSPGGYDFSASKGIITSVDRNDLAQVGSFFQIDAEITNGASESPLINLKTGKVIGINTYAKIRDKGDPIIPIGFSQKIDLIKPVLKQLKEKSSPPPMRWIGLRVDEISS